jgi:ubiquinone/menaquinone biosynthesis C-methylase UbiE
MGWLAYRRIVKSGFTPKLVKGQGQKLPFPADTFDQVVSTFPSRYIFDVTTLTGIYRVLLPGGKLVVLPVAWIDRKRFFDRLAAGLFDFTRQAPKWEAALADPFIAAGFQLKIDHRRLASSEVLLIIATKPSRQLPEMNQSE